MKQKFITFILLACCCIQMVSYRSNDPLQVVIIERVSFLIALALVPDEAFDVIALREVGQTVVNLLKESFQQ